MKFSVGIFAVVGFCLTDALAEDAGVAFFRDEVKPILEANCFGCHGGVNKRGKVTVRSGLQLISRKGILMGGDHGAVFNEEEPEKSLILEMISYKDGDHEMPPKGKLAAEEIETLKKWVAMGVPWTPEDADRLVEVEEESRGPRVTEVNDHTKNYWSYKPMARPEVPGGATGSAAVDALLEIKRQEAGLEGNGPAAKAELVRRVTYGLTGLAPTPEEVARFVADDREEAWPELVDRLLDSPQYGEKWGRHWLDLVRYAESNGFERDSEKEFIWRYRDYVIAALNQDKPYDQFLREQLAGDELDEVTGESMVATGFHRLMQWDDEPADRLQHKYDVLDDNVRVVSEGMLGMTLGCARCHDHKGDPMSQKDYFKFMSFFHGITDMSKGGVIEEVALKPGPQDVERWKRDSERRRNDLRREIKRLEERAMTKLRAVDPGAFQEAGARLDHVASAEHGGQANVWSYMESDPGDGWSEVGYRPGDDWKKGRAPFGTGAAGRQPKTRTEGKTLWLQTTFRLAEIPEAVKLRVFHDDSAEIYLNGQRIADLRGYVKEYVDVDLDQRRLAVLQTGRNVVSVRLASEGGGQLFDLSLSSGDGMMDPANVIATRGEEVLNEGDRNRYGNMVAELEKLAAQDGPTGAKAMIVREHGVNVSDLHVHIRGNAGVNGDKVEPGFPGIFGGAKAVIPEPKPGSRSSGRRRVLADWITRDDNPRTARVMMNRVWQHHFGVGICPTPNDFGFLGEKATHPELLDWLAMEFVEKGWSLKAMHRLLLNTEAYRMSSRGRADGLASDPQNQFYWRFNMRRLTAEEIRDSMLQVAGLLNLKQGGPGIYVPLPQAVLATSSTGAGKWGRASEEDARRRSVYVRVKRSLKPPEFTAFDFADTDSSCPVRFTTTVPTQALNMLNSEFINRQAMQFAERLRSDKPGDVRGQVERGLELALSRPAVEAEVKHCLDFIGVMKREYELDDNKALERFCLLALNLNEFVYLD